MTRTLLALLIITPLAGAPLQQQSKPADEKQEKQDKEQKKQGSQASGQQAKPQPSLAELAEKSREERSRQERPALVYTNSVIKRTEGGKVGKTDAPQRAAADEEAAGEGGEEALDPEQALAKVAEDLAAKRMEYVTAVNQHQVVQLSLNELRNRFLRESNVATQQKFQADLAAKMEELNELEKVIQDTRQQLDQLRSQAQTLGMQPGQIRDLIGRLPEPQRIVDDSGGTDNR